MEVAHLNQKQLAARWSISEATLERWRSAGIGPKFLKLCGRVLYRQADIDAYEESCGLNDPGWQIAQACEEILLSSGLLDEAYRRHAIEANQGTTNLATFRAIEANQGTTNLATFRAIAKKYPHKQPEEILRDLIASTPGAEGKWFAAAKDAGLFDAAIELATRSPTDPRTLTRAARDYSEKQPAFALGAGLAALRWISLGHGYDITGADVLDAYSAVTQAVANAGVPAQQVNEQIREMIASTRPGNSLMKTILTRHLSN